LAVSFFNNQEEVKIYQARRAPQGARVVWWVVIVSNQKAASVIHPVTRSDDGRCGKRNMHRLYGRLCRRKLAEANVIGTSE
jgi:hypothetical protein